MAKDTTYKPEDKGNKELFSMIFYRPAANFILMRIVRHLPVTPNMVSFLSLGTALAAAYLFFLQEYKYLLLGAVFLNVTYIFDVLDGQLARYKGLSSGFGRLLDAALDVIKISVLFAAISCGIYARTHDFSAVVFGFIAMSNAFLTCYMMIARKLFVEPESFTVKVGGSVYVGYEISLYLILTVFALCNRMYFGLVFLATAGALSWMKIFADQYVRYARKI